MDAGQCGEVCGCSHRGFFVARSLFLEARGLSVCMTKTIKNEHSAQMFMSEIPASLLSNVVNLIEISSKIQPFPRMRTHHVIDNTRMDDGCIQSMACIGSFLLRMVGWQSRVLCSQAKTKQIRCILFKAKRAQGWAHLLNLFFSPWITLQKRWLVMPRVNAGGSVGWKPTRSAFTTTKSKKDLRV